MQYIESFPNHPSPTLVEKLSSTKLVPGTKKFQEHRYNRFRKLTIASSFYELFLKVTFLVQLTMSSCEIELCSDNIVISSIV